VFILVSELNDGVIAKTFKVVYFNEGLKNWETVLCVRYLVVPVQVDTSDLNLITWSCSIYKIV
jgi:hypothetical protein